MIAVRKKEEEEEEKKKKEKKNEDVVQRYPSFDFLKKNDVFSKWSLTEFLYKVHFLGDIVGLLDFTYFEWNVSC